MYQVKAPKNSAESSDWSDWWVLTIMNPWQCRRPSCISLEGVVLGGQLDSHDALWYFSCFVLMFNFHINIYIYNVHCTLYRCPWWYTQNILPSPFPSFHHHGTKSSGWSGGALLEQSSERGAPCHRPDLGASQPHVTDDGSGSTSSEFRCFVLEQNWWCFILFLFKARLMCSEDVVSCLWDLWWS